MVHEKTPEFFRNLLSDTCITASDIIKTQDCFFLVYKSLSNILFEKNILDFPDSDGTRLACSSFFDDWFLYAVPDENGFAYSLLKFREQEHDAEDGNPTDRETPGVTVSFISFQLVNLKKDIQH